MIKINMSMKLIFKLFCLSLMSVSISACGGDEEEDKVEPEVLDITTFQASISVVGDVENNGNPSDISVTINSASASSVSEYRVFYVEAANIIAQTETDLVSLKELDLTHYTKVNVGMNEVVIHLKDDQLSASGQVMVEGEEYKIQILSIGTFNEEEVLAISEASEAFEMVDTRVLDIAQYEVSAVAAEDCDNDGNASDIVVSFSGANAAEIIQYRILAVKEEDATNFTVETAASVSNGFSEIVMDDQADFKVELSELFVDYQGNALAFEKPYQFFVLTEGSFKDSIVYTLSTPSLSTMLVQNKETTTLVPDFRGNGSIHIDDEGNLYINEFGQGQGNAGLGTSAFKVTPSGQVTEFVSRLSGPVGNTLDADGNYYVNDGNEGREGEFTRIAPDGTVTVLATIDGYPADILTGIDGNFYIVNWTRAILHKVTPTGELSSFAEDTKLSGCTGITYGNDDMMIVSNFTTGDIMSVDMNGVVTVIATVPTVADNFVIGYIAFYDDHIYATGYGSNKIYKVSMDGTVAEFAGSGDLDSYDAQFDKASFRTPNGIAIDENRKILYVTQNGNGTPLGLRAIPLD